MRAVGSLESRPCMLHSQSDHRKNCVYPTRDIAWAGRNTQSVTWSTFALICLWYVCFLVFSFLLFLCLSYFLSLTNDSRRLTEHIHDWHTQRALLNDKKLTPAARHVLLSILVMTSPAPDVWPSILTDYTYDSELDNADGVPHSVYDAARVPGGELWMLSWTFVSWFTFIHCLFELKSLD